MEDYLDAENSDENIDIKPKKKSGAKIVKKLGKHKQEKKSGKNLNKIFFEEYFEAYKSRKEFISSNNDGIQKLDFTIESYNDLIDKMQKNKLCKEFLNEQSNRLAYNEKINTINTNNLYELIIELLKNNSNIFLYGYGSKLKLIYEFINYFQNQVNGKDNENYHLLIFNCYNPEISVKYILNEILMYVSSILCNLLGLKEPLQFVNKIKTLDEQVHTIKDIMNQLDINEFQGRFLLIFNNIDGPNFVSKPFQNVLSNLSHFCPVSILATSDNLYINYCWTQAIKDNFSFFYLKFHTFSPFDVEITDKNSLSGEKNIKAGSGLSQIFKSLTQVQKDVIKTMAEIQMKGDLSQMTVKGLVDYMIDSGSGLCNSQNRFMELILEPRDHDIIVSKIIPKTNKEIFKLNLENEVIEKIIAGEYDGEEDKEKEAEHCER